MNDRTIKFRVYNKATKSWVHGPGDECNLFGEYILFGEFMSGVSLEGLNDCVALQFTGLLDKNGKEIYEGDILKVGQYLSEIFFREGSFAIWIDKSAWLELSQLSQRGSDSLIIGNIFDNPELLTK